MRNDPKVIVILLNYCNWQYTLDCVQSLNQCIYSNFKIIIIDNNSPNDSERMLREKLPNSLIYQTGSNLGYTGGINFGIKKAIEEDFSYILILNPDTLVDPNFLNILVEGMEVNPTAAAGCGTIYHYPKTNDIWYAGGKMVPWRGLAVHNHTFPNENGRMDKRPRFVSFITGCMAFLRRSTLLDIGLQDERFFMYLDDIEYSARITKKGYDLLYIPSAIIYHRIEAEEESPFKLYYSVRNRLLLISTSFSMIERIIATIYFLMVITVKLIVWGAVKPSLFRAAYAGLYDYFTDNLNEGRGVSEFLTLSP